MVTVVVSNFWGCAESWKSRFVDFLLRTLPDLSIRGAGQKDRSSGDEIVILPVPLSLHAASVERFALIAGLFAAFSIVLISRLRVVSTLAIVEGAKYTHAREISRKRDARGAVYLISDRSYKLMYLHYVQEPTWLCSCLWHRSRQSTTVEGQLLWFSALRPRDTFIYLSQYSKISKVKRQNKQTKNNFKNHNTALMTHPLHPLPTWSAYFRAQHCFVQFLEISKTLHRAVYFFRYIAANVTCLL